MGLNNPNAGPDKNLNGPGRVRDTQTSNNTKNGGTFKVPGVPGNINTPTMPNFGADYSGIAGASAASAAAWTGFQSVVAAAEADRKQHNAAFKVERAKIRQEAIGSMSEVINNSIESGMIGSSATGQEAIGVLGQRRMDIEAANTERKSANIDSKLAVQQGYANWAIQDAQIQMQASAARTQAALAQQAIDAQNANTAAIIDAMPGEGSGGKAPPPIVIGGKEVPVTPIGNGEYEIGGMIFPRGTPIPTIINSIKRRRGETAAWAADQQTPLTTPWGKPLY
jgi:hypothetical protein